MNNHNEPHNAENRARMLHECRFGPHFHIAVYRSPEDGFSIGFTHHGSMLSPDPEGHFAREAFEVFMKYGKRVSGGPVDRLLYETWTTSGLGIDVFELEGRTYLQVSLRRRIYRLDATLPGGPLEQAINALRRRFPDCTYD